MDQESRTSTKAQYDEDMAAYEAQGKGKNKGERGPAPKEPVFRDPFTQTMDSISSCQ